MPVRLVSDDGSQFKTEEFQQFLKRNGIKSITSAPYYPPTNGLAERRVGSFKNAIKSETEVKSLNIQLGRFLPPYRNIPHSTTGEPPSQLFFGRRLSTRRDLSVQISNRQIHQSIAKGSSVTRHFSIGQRVIARNYNGKSKWVPGTVHAQLEPLSNEIEIRPVWSWLVDQIRDSHVPVADIHTPVIQPLLSPPPVENYCDLVADPSNQTEVVPRERECQLSNPAGESSVSSPLSQLEPVPVRRYPTRERKNRPGWTFETWTLNCPLLRVQTLSLRVACCVQ